MPLYGIGPIKEARFFEQYLKNTYEDRVICKPFYGTAYRCDATGRGISGNHDLSRTAVRLGVAEPVPGYPNEYLHEDVKWAGEIPGTVHGQITGIKPDSAALLIKPACASTRHHAH